MNILLTTYIFYLLLTITLTIWVGKTLHKNGRLFLIDAFNGDEPRADAVNHLLVVGFYLINFGFASLFLKMSKKPDTLVEAMEFISVKIGVVLVVLGIMHFFNMFNFDRMRKKGKSFGTKSNKTL